MKRSTIYLLVAGAILAVGMSAAYGKGSSHPPKSGTSGGSLIDAKAMPRAINFGWERNWQSDAGEILICPYKYQIAEYQWKNMWCFEEVKEGKTTKKIDRWMSMHNYKVDGMELKAYEIQYVGSGGSKMLTLYFGPPEKVESEFDKVDRDYIMKAGTITINANKVIVQRRKK